MNDRERAQRNFERFVAMAAQRRDAAQEQAQRQFEADMAKVQRVYGWAFQERGE